VGLFQKPARTTEELDASRPLDIPPERVLENDEAEWYARVYRPNAAQLTIRAVVLGSILGFFLSFTNIYIGLGGRARSSFAAGGHRSPRRGRRTSKLQQEVSSRWAHRHRAWALGRPMPRFVLWELSR
jgi:hypothetical protein